MKKTFLILIVLSVLAGCALDDIKQKPTCTTSNDFSQLDGSQYSEDALVDVDQVCPSEAETNPNCYQNLKSPSTYLCTICPRNQYYCYNSCVDTPCETNHCHYADDMIAKEAPEYTGLPVANTTCATENDYRYCYVHNKKNTDYLCTHCAKDSDTPRYCPQTKTCVDTFCEDCSQIHVTLSINGETTELCAIPIDSAKAFVEASKEPRSDAIYALTQDIDLSDLDAYSSGNVDNWTGFYQFSGKFVAAEPHKISINGGSGTLSCGTSETCGLFPHLEGATIYNIDLAFNVKHTGSAGLLAGIIDRSTIAHVNASGTVSASTQFVGGVAGIIRESSSLTDITFSGNVDAPDANYVGGITGGLSKQSSLNAIQLKSSTISGKSYVGGITGSLTEDATISDATLTFDTQISGENIVGGLVGASTVPLSNLTSDGKLTMTPHEASSASQVAGGIVALFSGNSLSNLTNKTHLTITDTTNPTPGGTSVGGIAGSVTEPAALTNLRNEGKITYNSLTKPPQKLPNDCLTQIGGIVGSLGKSNTLSTIDGATNQGIISTDNLQCVGGIVGKATNTTIRNAQNNADVLATDTGVGGIAGVIMLENLPQQNTSLNYSNLQNAAEIKGLGYTGGIIGLVLEGFYMPTDLTFSNLKNSGMIRDTNVENNNFMPHGGIFGMLAAQTSSLILTDLENTGDIEATSTTPTGGLIGLWKNYEATTEIVPDTLRYVLRRSFSRATLSGSARLGGLIGQLNLTRNDQKLLGCTLTCYDSHIDVTLEDVFAEGDLKGTTDIGGLIGYVQGTPNSKSCTRNPSDSCDKFTITKNTYATTSTLNILNTYASVNTSGDTSVTGLIGLLVDYQNPSDTNKIAIDNFYFATTAQVQLSGLICNTPNNILAVPEEVAHIYIQDSIYDQFKSNDYIAPHVNTIFTYHKKSGASDHNTFVGDKPLVDVLNENRGDHAEWIEAQLPNDSLYYPTLNLSQENAP